MSSVAPARTPARISAQAPVLLLPVPAAQAFTYLSLLAFLDQLRDDSAPAPGTSRSSRTG